MAIRVLLGCVLLVLITANGAPPMEPLDANNRDVKNVIILVPDGMGLANVTATRLRLAASNPELLSAPLNLETLEHVGYQMTYSKTNTVTDSSAAASAWACGEKFVNNEVCFHADGAPYNRTLLELAKEKGMATGLVATQTVTHATPAAFAAHTANRNCETEIARQYVNDTKPDVLLGGGQATFKPSEPDKCGTTGDFIAIAQTAGYTYVQTAEAMKKAVADGKTRLLGLFAGKSLTPEYQRTADTTQPRLPDMTTAALSILEQSKTGFFLMVEGSLIDSANHAENMDYQFGEITAFDQSVKVVLDWIKARPNRQRHTLLIIPVDHETGGFAVKGIGTKAGELPNEGLGPFVGSWVFTLIPGDKNDFESHHTAGDVMIWSQGPGSKALARGIDNTFVYEVVKHALKR